MPARVDSLGDTIVACSTPPGEGAIAVVRLSGPAARQIAAQLAPAKQPRASHALRPAKLFDRRGNLLDAGMVVEMHAPHSYTGEDLVELHLHGSRAVVAGVRAACVQAGARLARPGEFTLRAFLNGRMDLAQAEAVADLVAAASDTQRDLATRQLEGGLSRVVSELLDGMERVLADWQAALDFPEHASGEGVALRHWKTVEKIDCRIQSLLDSSRVDLHRGQRVALCGAPNVGKSTLLNVWAGEQRVLVDAAPGTTRDPVEVELSGQVGRWSVIDTAGIRRGAEGLEAAGIDLALQWARGADLVLWLVAGDGPQWPPASDGRVVPGRPSGRSAAGARNTGRTADWLGARELLIAGSKADLVDERTRQAIAAEARDRGLAFAGWVSGLAGEGVEPLRRQVVEHLRADAAALEAVVVRQRHVDALRSAHEGLQRLQRARREAVPEDLLAMELEAATKALGQIVGRDVDAAVLERVFSEFCIGK